MDMIDAGKASYNQHVYMATCMCVSMYIFDV